MQYSFLDSSVPALTPFWFRIVSMMTAVLPVWRSPMISSRWPRPIGISASIAFRPVCIGSCTDLRGMMPGAFTSTRIRSTLTNGPLPSIGLPRPSTTRPSKPRPAGTSTIEPVRETVSPSRMARSSPKITMPTLSVSRFNAMPRKPAVGNSTISPAMQFCRPNTRAMPSPTDNTWPVSATLASVSNAAICFFKISEISAGRISISGGSLHRVLQALQPGFQTGVVKTGADPDDQAAEQIRLDLLQYIDVAVARFDQAGAQLLPLQIVQRLRRQHMRGNDASAIGDQRGKRGHDLRQRAQPAVARDDAHEIADRFAEALLLQHRERGFGTQGDVDQGGFDETAEVGAVMDQEAQRFHFGDDGVERANVLRMRVERGGVTVGEAATFRDRRSFRRHVRFHLSGHARTRG